MALRSERTSPGDETPEQELERLRTFERDVYLALAAARIPRAGGPGIELLAAERDGLIANRDTIGAYGVSALVASSEAVPGSVSESYALGRAKGAEDARAIMDGREPA